MCVTVVTSSCTQIPSWTLRHWDLPLATARSVLAGVRARGAGCGPSPVESGCGLIPSVLSLSPVLEEHPSWLPAAETVLQPVPLSGDSGFVTPLSLPFLWYPLAKPALL